MWYSNTHSNNHRNNFNTMLHVSVQPIYVPLKLLNSQLILFSLLEIEQLDMKLDEGWWSVLRSSNKSTQIPPTHTHTQKLENSHALLFIFTYSPRSYNTQLMEHNLQVHGVILCFCWRRRDCRVWDDWVGGWGGGRRVTTNFNWIYKKRQRWCKSSCLPL